MAWSTRELAEPAGTTLKTVRHYHRIGLLEEPERAANGYKRYRVKHLVRLLRIRRPADLGDGRAPGPALDTPAAGTGRVRLTARRRRRGRAARRGQDPAQIDVLQRLNTLLEQTPPESP
jgi:hypothetical protein